jgi:hypothetical protein
MIDRRGMARAHSTWRPRPRAPQPPANAWPIPRRRRFAVRVPLAAGAALAALVVLVGLAAAAGFFAASAGKHQAVLPRTPRAWLDTYEAAAVESPARVCSELLSAQLAAVFGHNAHGSCVRYFSDVYTRSVKVLRVLRDGPTAVLDMRQAAGHVEWNVVLDRRSGGWQAVDMFYGQLKR